VKTADTSIQKVLEKWEAKIREKIPFETSLNITAIPKGRPRHTSSGHAYTPERTRDYEAAVRYAAQKKMQGKKQFLATVRVTIFVYKTVPKSYSKEKRVLASLGWIIPSGGDLDNYVKAVTDALNGVVYHDDKQIGELHAKVRYGPANKVIIKVAAIGVSLGESESICRELKNEHRRGSSKVG